MFNGYKAGSLFVLEQDMPELSKGTIFELREPTGERGSIACGFLTNIWVNGNVQDGWVAETHMVPGQLSKNREWFAPVKMLNGDEDVFTVNGKRFKRI